MDACTGTYIHQNFGMMHVQVPTQFKLGPLSTITAGLGLLPRAGKGTQYRKSKLPKQSLEIWGYESSPFVKIAREVMELHVAQG